MEHIIQFGITIDDDKIEHLMMEKASKECLEQVRKGVQKYTKSTFNYESDLDRLFKAEVKSIVTENKTEIIDKVVKQVASNLMKTKDILSAKAQLVDSISGEN